HFSVTPMHGSLGASEKRNRRAHRPNPAPDTDAHAATPINHRSDVVPNLLNFLISLTSFRLRTPRLSCATFFDSRPLFSIASALFDKTRSSHYVFRSPLWFSRAPKAQKGSPASPVFAALTNSRSRKSFPCTSYANTRDGGV